MKAIILAAGLGTRLRPMTENTPKALVKVNQKPLVEYQIEYLKERGIDDIIIVVGYLKEQFDYLKEMCIRDSIGAEKDDVLGVDGSLGLHHHIKGSQLIILPGCGHALYEQNKDFQKRVLVFLES